MSWARCLQAGCGTLQRSPVRQLQQPRPVGPRPPAHAAPATLESLTLRGSLYQLLLHHVVQGIQQPRRRLRPAAVPHALPRGSLQRRRRPPQPLHLLFQAQQAQRAAAGRHLQRDELLPHRLQQTIGWSTQGLAGLEVAMESAWLEQTHKL